MVHTHMAIHIECAHGFRFSRHPIAAQLRRPRFGAVRRTQFVEFAAQATHLGGTVQSQESPELTGRL